MPELLKIGPFRVAVSKVLVQIIGHGVTRRKSESVLYYYAEKDSDENGVNLQDLNKHYVPTGERRMVSDQVFFSNYRPEPLFYYNKVKPAIDAVEAGMAKAEKHLQNAAYDKAEREYKHVLGFHESNVRAIFGLGIAYLQGDKSEEASVIFEKIMLLEIGFTEEHKHLFNEFGICMRKKGMFECALQYYYKALRYGGEKDEHLLFNVGRLHFDMSSFDEAVQAFEKALNLNPAFAEAERFKVEAYSRLNRRDPPEDGMSTPA